MRLLRVPLVCVPALVALALLAPSAEGALTWVRGNPADRLLAKPLEDYRYDYARKCVRRPSRGALALQRWLGRRFRGESWGIVRCERLSGRKLSLHSEGRALDWHLSARAARDRRAARKLIRLLLAPDRTGNPHALARRMGVQEIIWNCRSWWSGAQDTERYSACYDRRGRRKRISDTLAHRDHVHIGLSRAGAGKRTSFWRR